MSANAAATIEIAPLLDKPTAIVGTTGAGKTFLAKGAVEQLLELGRRVIVIDPTSAWWGLRAGADGKAKGGFPVLIFGGDHADIPISPDAGEKIAEALAGRDVQAIIDTSEMTGNEKTRFMTAFLQKLYALNKAALHLVVDEADEVCPQNPMPEERRLSGAFDKIVRRGRIKGFRPLMITQRPAVLHKNVLSQIGTLIALKLTSPQDRKAIEDWVKGNADAGEARAVMSSLPTLKRGEGWVWSPADHVLERVAFPPIRTFDSSRTPSNVEVMVEPALTAVDVEALRDAMKVAEVVLEAGVASARGASKAEIEAAEKRGYDRGFAAGDTHGFAKGIEHGKTIGAGVALAAARGALDALRIPSVVADAAASGLSSVPAADVEGTVARIKRAASGDRKPTAPRSDATARGDGTARLLAAIDTSPEVSWAAAAIRAGYAESGGGFRKAKKSLLESGLAADDGGRAVITTYTGTGRVPSRDELIALWRDKLWSGAAGLLGVLHDGNGHMSIDMLAAGAGYSPSGGGFRKALKLLRSSGLVASDERNAISLSRAFCEAAGE